MEFRILGPLEVLKDGVSVRVSAPRERALLAVLLLQANRIVPMNRLITTVWDGVPPETARNQVQICISALRRIFSAVGAGGLISTCAPGYRLDLIEETVDAVRFEAMTTEGMLAAEDGRWPDAVRILRAALALWRGSAAEGIDSHVVQVAATPLNESRLAALEACIGLELKMGNHVRVIGELAALTNEYPLRERLRAYHMLALYRSGRRAEALAAYREARRHFIEELGLDLGQELQQLEQAILSSDTTFDLRNDTGALTPPALQQIR